MKFLFGLSIFVSCYLTGIALQRILDLPVPAAVMGMVLLLILQALLKSHWRWFTLSLNSASKTLLPWLPLFIVPASVGVMMHLELLAEHWWPLALSLVFSLLVSMAITPFAMRKAIQWSSKNIHQDREQP